MTLLKKLEKNKCPTCYRILYRSRTLPQNAYYHGVVCQLIAEHTGYSIDEVHEVLKQMFLKNTIMIGNKEYNVPRSTKELDTVQMEEYLKHIREWASNDLGIYIPMPNEPKPEEYGNTIT